MATSTAIGRLEHVLDDVPPLTSPPLSLLGLAPSIFDGTNRQARAQALRERLASAQEQLRNTDAPDNRDPASKAAEIRNEITSLTQALGKLDDGVDESMRWEAGFIYLPELGLGATSLFTTPAYQTVTTKPDGVVDTPFLWYDPWETIGIDDRSGFGWSGEGRASFAARAQRARRAQEKHESWQAEYEFWTGATCGTNMHLSASPHSPLTSPNRNSASSPFTSPVVDDALAYAEHGGATALSLSASLAALDQAIADSDAGAGMIHASCYVVQQWQRAFNYINRGPGGQIWTVNGNLIVPGYGYPGTGPDTAGHTGLAATANTGTTANVLTFASGALTTADVGRPISDAGSNGYIPAGTYIVAILSATTALLSNAVTGSVTSVNVLGTGGSCSSSPQQWAYATDMQYHLQGDVRILPSDMRENSPALFDNEVPVRAERTHAIISNQLVRAAVPVDTTQI